MAFRREIVSDLMIALMSNLRWLDEPSANAPNARVPTLFHISRGGPATISCAEGIRYSSPAGQRGAPPSFHAPRSHLGQKAKSSLGADRVRFAPENGLNAAIAAMSEKCHKETHAPQQTL